MLVLPHVATGAAIGALVGDPLVVIPVAIASHFILDSVPHWQETMAPYIPTWKTYLRIPIDVALGVGVVIYALSIQPDHSIGILLGALFASAPDLDVITIKLPKLQQGIIKKYWDWHCKIQREITSLWGVATQLVVIALSLAVIHAA
jgi:hypothetical protein